MLIETVRKFYGSEYDLNCAETILYAANEEYNLKLTKETFKTMAAFGGGMAIEDTCGAATGAITVLGLMFIKDRAHESEYIKSLTKEFMEKFKERCTTLNCARLKELYRNDETGCLKLVEIAAEILDAIVERESGRRTFKF